MNQLFVILKETFDALSADETSATVAALREAGLYALPFPTVDVRIAGDCVAFCQYSPALDKAIADGHCVRDGEYVGTNYGDGHWMDYRNISLDHCRYIKEECIERGHAFLSACRERVTEWGDSEFGPNERERDAVANLLIVLLATRNAVKTTVRRKSAALGIGKNKHEYTTTISLPREMEDDPDHAPKPGGTRCPHLRRGHNRRQHYGPRSALVRTQWIAPVFVNADKEWTRTRVAYNVSL